jgi:hypothetical protein
VQARADLATFLQRGANLEAYIAAKQAEPLVVEENEAAATQGATADTAAAATTSLAPQKNVLVLYGSDGGHGTGACVFALVVVMKKLNALF